MVPRVQGLPLDSMVDRLLALSPFEYRLARDDAERAVAFRLRAEAAVARGWRRPADFPDREERDEYDARAAHVVGWDGDVAVCTGRIVLPPGIPTEDVCGIVVRPEGRVADVGRMCVAPSRQSLEHGAFLGLMCRLYSEVRALGYDYACGLMSAPARALLRMLGLEVDLLGPERMHWSEPRAPVGFSLLRQVGGAQGDVGVAQGAASASTVFAPPKPKEFDSA
jgi:hypothetical protein